MNEYVGELKMKEPLTKEDWDIIADTDFKHTSKVTFTTPHCGEVEFVKVVRCKYCKHRPIDTGGHNYGQDLLFPDEDNVCPCQCGDPWYSWMPGDDWFCANGERKDDGEN